MVAVFAIQVAMFATALTAQETPWPESLDSPPVLMHGQRLAARERGVRFSSSVERAPRPASFTPERVLVEWHPAHETFAGGRQRVVFRGRLAWNDALGGASPVDWLQGVRVVVARSPGEAPSWEAGYDSASAAWGDALASNDGTFACGVDVAKLRREAGVRGRHRVGLVLAETVEPHHVVWSGSAPVLDPTVSTVVVGGAPILSATQQIVNAVTGLDGGEHDPAALVRAVNHLHALGRERAIEELASFLATTEALNDPPAKRRPSVIDSADRSSVYLIVRALFLPARRGGRVGDLWLDRRGPFGVELARDGYPLIMRGCPVRFGSIRFEPDVPALVWAGDVPYRVVRGYSHPGSPEDPEAHLAWAANAEMRASPIVPAPRPVVELEAWLAGAEASRGLRAAMTAQLWLTLEHLIGPSPRAPTLEALRERLAGRALRWSEDRGTYVLVR